MPRAPGIIGVLAFLTILLITSPLVSCAGSAAKRGLLETTTPEAAIDSGTLRAWTYEFTLNYADRIQEAADQIAEQAQGIEVRRNALRWKISATQAGFRAASRRDALAALADLWILCRQMTVFFETGPGRDVFGDRQPIAVDTCRGLEARIESFAQATLIPERAEPRMVLWRKYVNDFAATYPIESLTFIREPLTGRAGTAVAPPATRLAEVAGGLQADVNALQRMFAATVEYMPTIVLWQAELALLDAERVPAVADALANLRAIPGQFRDIMRTEFSDGLTPAIRAAIGDDMPRIAAGETDKIIAAIREERETTLEALEHMRSTTIEFITQERDSIIAEVDRQRVATLDDVRAESRAAMQQITDIVHESTASASAVGENLIDRLASRLTRLAIGLVASLIVVCGGVMLVRAALTRDRRA